ncbi:MAG: Flp pilus assembly protein CpaB [bacterium]|nr:Flp pilus assembly protein CpaB [bacterium]
MRNNKHKSKILLAVLVALLATFISYATFSNMQNELNEQKKMIAEMSKDSNSQKPANYAYAIALTDLMAGQTVTENQLVLKDFDEENPVAFQKRSDVIGKVLLKNIHMGEVFTASHFAEVSNDDVSLREGYRAITLPADNFQGKAKSMTQGKFVDIYSTIPDNNWFLEHVRILAFDDAKLDDGKDKKQPASNILTASSITFEVPVSSISDFISNTSKGRLVLVVRDENDRMVRKIVKKSFSSSGNNYSDFKNLSKIPSAPPISDLSGISDLPEPIQPSVHTPSVEVIEANVKSKVTFD